MTDGQEYDTQCVKYETVADLVEAGSDTITITGVGCSLKVWGGALEISSGKTHIPQMDRVTKLYRGTHKVKSIVILSDDGNITLRAAEWCISQDIQVVVIDNMSRTLLMTGDSESDAKLRRLQYQANDTGMSGFIARELVRMKIVAQMSVMKSVSEVRYRKVMKRYWANSDWDKPPQDYLENLLVELDSATDVRAILIIEAHAAQEYWSAFKGLPISWEAKYSKKVPPHWKAITGRISTLSSGISAARYATNPFHSALNYGYALLKSQVLRSILSVGLDPSCGFLHADKDGRDSLAYDLMEAYRPQVDQLVLKLFMETTFRKGMVIQLESGECKLNPQLARTVVLTCRVPQRDVDAAAKWVAGVLQS
jgi:CRISPR-associated protein Cas1